MRLKFGVLIAACALGSCNAGPAAEKRYDIVAETKDTAAMCTEARKVAQAYLADGNSEKYQEWKLHADVSCLTNEIAR